MKASPMPEPDLSSGANIRGIRVPGLPDPISHYTDAVVAGRMLYISGIASFDQFGAVVGKGDPVEQAQQIFRNMQRVLDAVGGQPSSIVKVTVFMKNIDHRPLINPVRQKFFGSHRPASTLVQVSKLASEDYLLEIDAVGVLDSSQNER